MRSEGEIKNALARIEDFSARSLEAAIILGKPVDAHSRPQDLAYVAFADALRWVLGVRDPGNTMQRILADLQPGIVVPISGGLCEERLPKQGDDPHRPPTAR